MKGLTLKHKELGTLRVVIGENEPALFCFADICKIIDLHAVTARGHMRAGDRKSVDLPEHGFDVATHASIYFVTVAGLNKILSLSTSLKTKQLREWIAPLLPIDLDAPVEYPPSPRAVIPATPVPNDTPLLFTHKDFGKLRVTASESGEPLFRCVDVKKAIGMPGRARKRDITVGSAYSVATRPGRQVHVYIDTPALDHIVSRNRSPKAASFHAWVTFDVIPSFLRSIFGTSSNIVDEPELIESKDDARFNKNVETAANNLQVDTTPGIILSKDSDENQIRAYFNKILELSQSNEAFPVDLEEVWPLVYERKDYATDALKENFIESVDFQAFRQKPERGAASPIIYKLSVSCLEYFIARKVRSVFEVYRGVFHKAVEIKAIETPAGIMARAILVAKEQMDQMGETIHGLEEEKRTNAPKVEYFDNVLHSGSTYTATQMAKELGMTAVVFNRLLQLKKFQYFQSGQWLPTVKYQDCGYTATRTHYQHAGNGNMNTKIYTVFTEKGRLFLHEFLKDDVQQLKEQRL